MRNKRYNIYILSGEYKASTSSLCQFLFLPSTSLTLTTPSEEPVIITLLGSHSYMVEKDTHRICCWGECAPRAVLTAATLAPLMLHTCSQVPAHVAMSPYQEKKRMSQRKVVITNTNNLIFFISFIKFKVYLSFHFSMLGMD